MRGCECVRACSEPVRRTQAPCERCSFVGNDFLAAAAARNDGEGRLTPVGPTIFQLTISIVGWLSLRARSAQWAGPWLSGAGCLGLAGSITRMTDRSS